MVHEKSNSLTHSVGSNLRSYSKIAHLRFAVLRKAALPNSISYQDSNYSPEKSSLLTVDEYSNYNIKTIS